MIAFVLFLFFFHVQRFDTDGSAWACKNKNTSDDRDAGVVVCLEQTAEYRWSAYGPADVTATPSSLWWLGGILLWDTV